MVTKVKHPQLLRISAIFLLNFCFADAQFSSGLNFFDGIFSTLKKPINQFPHFKISQNILPSYTFSFATPHKQISPMQGSDNAKGMGYPELTNRQVRGNDISTVAALPTYPIQNDDDDDDTEIPCDLEDFSSDIAPSTQQLDKNPSIENAQLFEKRLQIFGKRLFAEMEKANSEKNIIISPLSIETCLAMIRMAADGQTAFEIDSALASASQSPQRLADNFRTALAPYQNNAGLKLANKIYIMEGYKIQEEFNESLSDKFFSSADSIDFSNSDAAAQTINAWVENKTNNKIKNLLQPDSLGSDTRLVLVNAIHFGREWLHPFEEFATRNTQFYLDETKTVPVRMMVNVMDVLYADLPEFDATAVDLPYKGYDLSFLVILPKSRTGLTDLEEKLKTISLDQITQNMSIRSVGVNIPKFKAEFEIELTSPLQNLGVSRMFSPGAELDKAIKSTSPLQVSKFVHKAVIEVNEKGTEAAAATEFEMMARTTKYKYEYFLADKPFVYFIKNANNLVIFHGNVKNFNT